MSGTPGHTPFGWVVDLSTTINEKTPLKEQWRQCMLNFKGLAQAMATLTLNTINIPPVVGGVIVSPGGSWTSIAPTASFQVLISDFSQPTHLAFTDLGVLVQTIVETTEVLPGPERRLLEDMVLLLEAILAQLQALNG